MEAGRRDRAFLHWFLQKKKNTSGSLGCVSRKGKKYSDWEYILNVESAGLSDSFNAGWRGEENEENSWLCA